MIFENFIEKKWETVSAYLQGDLNDGSFFFLGAVATLRSSFSETKIWSGEWRFTLSFPQDRFWISCFSSIGQIFLIFLKINILQLGHFASAIFNYPVVAEIIIECYINKNRCQTL